jgi:hypothetical protein
VLVITGESDPVDAPVTVVSLVERFGRERSMHDTLGCIEQVVAERLHQE